MEKGNRGDIAVAVFVGGRRVVVMAKGNFSEGAITHTHRPMGGPKNVGRKELTGTLDVALIWGGHCVYRNRILEDIQLSKSIEVKVVMKWR